MKYRVLWILVGALAAADAFASDGELLVSDPSALRAGHWLEVRGEWLRGDYFRASRAEIMEPQRREVLIGQATGRLRRQEFLLLGQPVRVSEKTDWEGVAPSRLSGERIKVEGHYRHRGEFSAREIEPRGPGRERITARVDSVRRTSRGWEARLMRFTVELPRGLQIEHQRPLEQLPLSPVDPERRAERERDEDDLFGDGIALGWDVRLGAQLEVRTTAEENFDLDDDDREDRVDDQGSARLRLEWQPSRLISTQAEGRFQVRYRDDEEDGTSTEEESRLGETFVRLHEPFGRGLDLAIGRQDFDDHREWIYDQNLDGVRLYARMGAAKLELSASTSLSDANRRDLEATNYIAYLSNLDDDRHLALYLIRREFDLVPRERTTHVGARWIGEWSASHDGWLELALMRGRFLEGDSEGWAVDLGTTWAPDLLGPFSLTVGYAYGSGDADSDLVGSTFRQTGLQDNNGKFGGVTSFRYYGELAEPELANLHIATLGVGFRLPSRTSLDLVGHYYRQDEARPVLVDTELDEDPDGIHTELGWEVDLIFGWRGRPDLDLEIVGAYFSPGDAFRDLDRALLGKVQLRYRI